VVAPQALFIAFILYAFALVITWLRLFLAEPIYLTGAYGARESIDKSWEITKGNLWTVVKSSFVMATWGAAKWIVEGIFGVMLLLFFSSGEAIWGNQSLNSMSMGETELGTMVFLLSFFLAQGVISGLLEPALVFANGFVKVATYTELEEANKRRKARINENKVGEDAEEMTSEEQGTAVKKVLKQRRL
jgi:hypothetical protein